MKEGVASVLLDLKYALKPGKNPHGSENATDSTVETHHLSLQCEVSKTYESVSIDIDSFRAPRSWLSGLGVIEDGYVMKIHSAAIRD